MYRTLFFYIVVHRVVFHSNMFVVLKPQHTVDVQSIHFAYFLTHINELVGGGLVWMGNDDWIHTLTWRNQFLLVTQPT